jgi:uncharacterized protein
MDERALPVEVDDAIVLLLGAPSESLALRGRIEGITRLEKLIFLLENETDLQELLDETAGFEAHNFGPFSSKIYQAVDTLTAAGLVEDSAELASSSEDSWESEEVVGTRPADPYATRNFTLTERGRRYYEALVNELPQSTQKMLTDFKARFGALPLRQLIRYVYKKYPAFTHKSVIRNEILK